MSATAPTKYRLPPGLPHALPFYFHKPWAKLGQPIRLFEHLHKTYGEIACYRFMGTNIIFVNHPEYIREVLINQAASFVKERTLQRMKILLGEGLITSDDPIHMRQRKLAAPAFHRQRIAAYGQTIVEVAQSHAARWKSGAVVDMNAAMMELSLEIVARTLFATEVTAEVRSINDEVNAIMRMYNFLIAMPRLESWLHWPVPILNRFRRSRGRLNNVVERMIRSRRADMVANPALDRGDLLSMLIASRYETDEGIQTEDGMTDPQVRDEVLTIFLAGYETVANALTWTWYCLSQNPDAEEAMLSELRAVLGDAATDPTRALRLPTLADYPRLKYTEQVFAEAMRLYPPAWAMGRMSTRDVTLGPYSIPAGAHFFFSQYVLQRSEEYFPDPLRFDPMRHTPEAKAARPRFAYFPFGGGSRQCIGESFAWMEGVLAIATIASRWRMDYTSSQPPVPQAKITLRPRDPVPMLLTAR
ncbi:MAG: cytochrome P450 [Acidobacteriota bacterium]|nr:cytochrome P450 [Acidobacteriota bacterium]